RAPGRGTGRDRVEVEAMPVRKLPAPLEDGAGMPASRSEDHAELPRVVDARRTVAQVQRLQERLVDERLQRRRIPAVGCERHIRMKRDVALARETLCRR